MKRLVALSMVMASASNCFAHYGDSSFEMPGWFKFMGIVMIVWGVLEIILFFKIWGMTDDVKALKKDHFSETAFKSTEEIARYLRKNLVLGNMENVKRTLLKNFIDNIEQAYDELQSYEYNGNDKWTCLEEQNLKKSIRPYVENLKKQYDKIGEDLPVYIQRMETFGDYYKLFVKEDLTVETESVSNENKE